MRARIGWAVAVLAALGLFPVGALELPETGIAYEIEVTLDPHTRTLDGRQTIRWRNPGGREIAQVPLHLYLNAFAHEDTTWMRGIPGRRLRADELLERWPDPWGWNEPALIRQAGVELSWAPIAPDDGNPLDRSLIEVTLAEPVPPGGLLELAVEFTARLPIVMARTGGYDDFFHAAHWFPKIAVFETAGTRGAPDDGWAAHQFHGPTEFYADYADYDVRIGVPRGWKVVATGSGGPLAEQVEGDLTWYRFGQRAVHDFAFTAGSRMVELTSSYQPEGTGGPVAIRVFLPEGTEHQAGRWRRTTEVCLDVLGARVGPYPYEVLTVVKPPARAARTMGMEYPTLFTGSIGDPLWDLGLFSRVPIGEAIVAHECAHQYFYGLVGSNEFEEAFLDEGFTQHWGNEILIAALGEDAGALLGRGFGVVELDRAGLPGANAALPPIWFGPSYLIRGVSIGTQFYARPATTLRTAAALFGRQTLDQVFALYYRRWAFGHPSFEDFLAAGRAAGGDEVADFLLEAFTRPRVPDYRVDSLETEVWSSPRGRLVTAEGVIEIVPGDDEAPPFAGLDPAAREADGTLLAEVLDPGWTLGGQRRPGRIERRRLTPRAGEPDEDWQAEHAEEEAAAEYHLSTARLEGPAWQHLPVEVRFRFADGAVIDDHWDGRAPYRIYRFLRAAPLSEVRIDPEALIAVDPDPANNARLRRPDRRLVTDWAAWLGAVFQLFGEALVQWL